MNTTKKTNIAIPPLGSIEPHSELLSIPNYDQLLYKVMSVENFLKSFSGSYIYFNRVDSYKDFKGADIHDGKQLPKDLPINETSKFQNAPDFSIADYYDKFRSRSYACCFSTENSDYIWNNFGNGGKKGKICIVFNFKKLRSKLNQTLKKESQLMYNGINCRQIFSINYGLVKYVERKTHRLNEKQYPTPIQYLYIKDKEEHGKENELRISLTAEGIGTYVLNDNTEMQFHPFLHMSFNYRAAIADKTIQQFLYSSNCDLRYIQTELQKYNIEIKIANKSVQSDLAGLGR